MKRYWKLKSAEMVPVIIGAAAMIKKKVTIHGKLLEAIWGSVTVLKRAPGTKL